MSAELPKPWSSFLAELDRQLSSRVTLTCLGGFAITMAYGLPRPTADIDVCDVIPAADRPRLVQLAGRGSDLHRKHGVYLQIVTVATIPEDYETRAWNVFPAEFKRLQLFVLDPYDLVLSKIERNSDRDIEDVKYLGRIVPLDLDELEERYRKELRPYLGRPEREDLTLRLWRDAIEEERS